MVAFTLGRTTFVFVHSLRIYVSIGAFANISSFNLSHENDERSSLFVLLRMEEVLSRHMVFISCRTLCPIPLMMWFLVTGSLRHSDAIFFLLPRATAFPRCLRRGVSLYFLGPDLYPIWVYNIDDMMY